jgi:hypothetical protein
VDGEDAVAEFSSRGPLHASGEVKPELVAPGVGIVAARATGTTLGEPVDDLYTALSGTSMAAPHAAGAAADLAQRHPDWTAPQLKAALTGSTDPIDADTFDAGAGRLDVGDAVASPVLPGVDVVDVDLAHPRTTPHTAELTWANAGDAPVTLALAAELGDRDGEPVPAAAVEPAELTIAPGATGSATLTVDGPSLDDGLYGGVVTADPLGDAAPDDDVRTAVGVYAPGEMATLRVEPTAPAGPPDLPAQGIAAIVNLDDAGLFAEVGMFQGAFEIDVPVGRYAVVGEVTSPDRDAEVTAQVGDTEVAVSGPTTVAFDGREAVPFTPSVRGVDTAPPMYASSEVLVTPEAGTGGAAFQFASYSWYPSPPLRVTPWDHDQVTTSQTYRLQAPHLTARIGREPVGLTTVGGHLVPEGDHGLAAVDVGDGADLSGAAGKLAIVQVPVEPAERALVSQRAAEAGVAVLAFVDEGREALTFRAAGLVPWGDLPLVLAAGEDAAALRAAAADGTTVQLSSRPSPYVYDIVTPFVAALDPAPVLSRSDQRALATLRERFHRDADGWGPAGDRRYPTSRNLMNLDSEGHLPPERTAHVTPTETWLSIVFGPAYALGFDELVLWDSIAVSMDAGVEYPGGRRTDVDWLRRPMPPGPVGTPRGASACQPGPVTRTAGTLQVWLAPFQDGPDRHSCADPHEARLTLERDGAVVGTADWYAAEFPVPDGAGTYRLTYTQRAEAPYAGRSETAWTFASGPPADGDERVPLLVVDYDLPLDTQNRPTGRRATLTAHQVTGTDDQPIRSLAAWTSVDDGATWQVARAQRVEGGEFRVTLPRAATGTPVSLRVDATDEAGNRIEQTLHQAYTA